MATRTKCIIGTSAGSALKVYFNGGVTCLQIYSTALSAEDINQARESCEEGNNQKCYVMYSLVTSSSFLLMILGQTASHQEDLT